MRVEPNSAAPFRTSARADSGFDRIRHDVLADEAQRRSPAGRGRRVEPGKAGKAVIVNTGETVSDIARRHHIPRQALYAANPRFDPLRQDGVVETDRSPSGGWDPDYLRPGDRIRLPRARVRWPPRGVATALGIAAGPAPSSPPGAAPLASPVALARSAPIVPPVVQRAWVLRGGAGGSASNPHDAAANRLPAVGVAPAFERPDSVDCVGHACQQSAGRPSDPRNPAGGSRGSGAFTIPSRRRRCARSGGRRSCR